MSSNEHQQQNNSQQPAPEIPPDLQPHFGDIDTTESFQANTMRKSSCETQWATIKNKFLSLRDQSRNVVKLTVQNEMSIARQIRRSDQYLSELLRDGAELITNVRIANDNRELQRRNANIEQKKTLKADLRAESAQAANKLSAIINRWGEMDNFKEPMGLYDCLTLQKSRIAHLMSQKDDLIAELHDALFQSDQQYQLDQTTKLNDLQCLVDRIDTQVDVMKQAYRSHLDILQKTVDMERNQFKTVESERWEKLYNELQTKQDNSEKKNNLKTVKYDEEWEMLCIKHQELNRSTRIQLDRDNDRLQVELQSVKADVLLNTEKLAYNFNVLQKRATENVIVKAQQKRRLARLNEVVLMNRDKCAKLKRATADESGRLTQEVQKLYSNLVSFGGKSDALNTASSQQYLNVWNVHESECITLLQNILTIDHEILTQFLGHQPSRTLDTTTTATTETIVQQIKFARPFQKRERIPSARRLADISNNYSSSNPLDKNTIKYVLEQLVDLTKWLQDEDVQKFFFGMEHLDEYTLIQVDQILTCFGISNMDHLMSLVELFVPNTNRLEPENHPEIVRDVDSTTSSETKPETVDAAVVFRAKLRQFIENFGQNVVVKYSPTSPPICEVQSEDVAQFWKSFSEQIPSNRDRLWTNLENGMNKYLQILKKRSKLDDECEFLRKQNKELKFLLLRYLPQPQDEDE